jgi:ABC-type nitrate/sulfonate/bicarbonate transport system substrate-binding protein
LLTFIPVGAAVTASVKPFLPHQAGALAQKPEIETVSVALDWYPNANHAGLYLAQERGYYAEEGLEPDFYTPSDPTTVLQRSAPGGTPSASPIRQTSSLPGRRECRSSLC